MTTEIKEEIRQKINDASGCEFKEVYPEYFLTQATGELFCACHVHTDLNFVEFTGAFSYKTRKQVQHFLPAQKFILN